MPGPAVRCPSCGHALFTVDEPAWPARVPDPSPAARGGPEPAGRLLLRVAEAAEVLAISRSSLYQLMSAGEVRTVRLGGAARVPRRELERLAGGGGAALPAEPQARETDAAEEAGLARSTALAPRPLGARVAPACRYSVERTSEDGGG